MMIMGKNLKTLAPLLDKVLHLVLLIQRAAKKEVKRVNRKEKNKMKLLKKRLRNVTLDLYL
jgi:hypothetical protein